MAKITVTGVGNGQFKADYVVIRMTVGSIGKDYEKAVAVANGKIAMLQSAIVGVGFEKEDLKTSDFSVNTRYNSVFKHGENIGSFEGYECRNNTEISFDFSEELLSKTLSSIAMSGAESEIDISFTVKNLELAKEQLLTLAATDAIRKAEILSKALGKKLGNLLTIKENGEYGNFVSECSYRIQRGIETNAVPTFAPTDITSSVNVEFEWEIV